jgi:outer membrane receptor protein involved in Fe transport
MSDRTIGQIAESGTFFAEEYWLGIDNSIFPETFRNELLRYWPDAEEFGIYIGKRNVEGGPRQSQYTHAGFRIVAGLKGAINDNWDYDVSYLFGETASTQAYVNDFFGPNIRVAVDGDLCANTAGCIPYEVFTYQGVTEEAANNMLGTAIMTGEMSTRVINGYVSGDLGVSFPTSEDNIMVVAGFEHRIERFNRQSDAVFEQTGGTSLLGQGGPRPSIIGQYSVQELFGEANIPLVSGMSGAQHLNLDLAYRYSDYSTAGDTSTYRVGLDWQPIEMVRVRAGFNRAVRAPNVGELFSPQSIGLWSGTDPCANEDGAPPEYTAAQCANMGVTADQYGNITASPAGQYNAIFGGNPELEPETADTITLGIVVTPMDNLQISVDYWSIKIEDTIANIGSPTILEQCGLYGVLCENVTRNQSGNLWQGTNGYVSDTTLNLGERDWEGMDFAFNWGTPALGGMWNVDMIGTYMMKKKYTPLPADPNSAYDCVGLASTRCFPTPDWRHTATAGYDSEEWWSVLLRWRYYGGVDYDGTTDTIAQKELSSGENYFDLSATFRASTTSWMRNRRWLATPSPPVRTRTVASMTCWVVTSTVT